MVAEATNTGIQGGYGGYKGYTTGIQVGRGYGGCRDWKPQQLQRVHRPQRMH